MTLRMRREDGMSFEISDVDARDGLATMCFYDHEGHLLQIDIVKDVGREVQQLRRQGFRPDQPWLDGAPDEDREKPLR